MKEIINVGLIGFGMAGRIFHAPIITSVKGLNLIKIRETKEDNIAIIKEKYPQAQVVPQSKDLFDDSNIDLIVIAAPNIAHFSLAKEALQANKQVVVDKPFTITSGEADELIALAKKQNKLLSVYHNRRFTSDFRTVQKIIKRQLLGTLVEYEVHYDRFRNFLRKGAWREENEPGSGILYDLGAHLIDQAQVLFGLPEAITADIRIQRKEAKAVDNFEVIMHYPALKVTLKSGMLVKEPGPFFTLLGDAGSYIKHGMDVQEEALKAGAVPNAVANWGEEPNDIWGSLNIEYKGLHFIGKVESEKGDFRIYYENIHKAIKGEENLLVKPEEARNTIRIIELAMQSSKERRTVLYS